MTSFTVFVFRKPSGWYVKLAIMFPLKSFTASSLPSPSHSYWAA
ncbi:hypothetical protein [Anoxybacillus sp. J5B_2022]|nr:hypothetical protein [Anoxybacillus sp. J5B_2022]